MFTVAPIELLDSVTSGVFITVSEPTKSAPTVLKSTERPPAAVEMRRPSYSVSLKSPPKPRTVMPVGLAARAGALDRHARDALQRRRDVGVRKFADVLGGDHVDHAGRLALQIEVSLQRSDETRDDDFVEVLRDCWYPALCACTAPGSAIDSANKLDVPPSVCFALFFRIWIPLL